MDGNELWNSVLKHMEEKFPPEEASKGWEHYTPEEVILSFIKDPEDHKVAIECFEQIAYSQRGAVVHLGERACALVHLVSLMETEMDLDRLKYLLIRELNGINHYITQNWDMDNYRHEVH